MAKRRLPATTLWIAAAIGYALFSVFAKDPPRDWSGHTLAENIAWIVGFCLPSEAIAAVLIVLSLRKRPS